jgi:hypothetical protein
MYRLIVEEPEFEIIGFGFEIFEEAMKINRPVILNYSVTNYSLPK